MISQRAKYALRALVMIAKGDAGQSYSIPEIAETQRIPKKFLEQILLELKRAGIVESRRGKDGGYLMRKEAAEVTYGDVLRVIDGPLALLPCLSIVAYRKCEDCRSETDCEIRHVFAKVAESTRAVLDQTSITDSLKIES
jgi:Rrf2 family protein